MGIVFLTFGLGFFVGFGKGKESVYFEEFKIYDLILNKVNESDYSYDLENYLTHRYYYLANRVSSSIPKKDWGFKEQDGNHVLPIGKGPTRGSYEYETFKSPESE
jgi:hypothetical protein